MPFLFFPTSGVDWPFPLSWYLHISCHITTHEAAETSEPAGEYHDDGRRGCTVLRRTTPAPCACDSAHHTAWTGCTTGCTGCATAITGCTGCEAITGAGLAG